MNELSIARRLARRALHRSRSASVIVVLALVALTAAWVATESVLAALDLAPLLVAPSAVVDLLAADEPVVLYSAIAAAMLGLVLLAVALAPARRRRHVLAHDRMVVVVDDDVLAGAIGRAGRVTAAVPASRVRTSVSTRRATISVVPTSGLRVDSEAVKSSAAALIERLDARPALRVEVAVAPSGVVGS